MLGAPKKRAPRGALLLCRCDRGQFSATFLPFVVAVLLDSEALAPDAGAENVTVTPATGLLPASRTVACNTAPNAAPTAAVCGVPAVAAIDPGAPA